MSLKILVAEDEAITRKHVVNALIAEGYEVKATGNGLDAYNRAMSEGFDLIITDIKMPGMDGLKLLDNISEAKHETEVIVVTGYGSIGSAVGAMKKGAVDYITKPFDLDELIIKVAKIAQSKALKGQNKTLKRLLDTDIEFIAESECMQKVIAVIQNIKDSDCHVLLTGESGVGKSILAKIIHLSSHRSGSLFFSLNCATFTEELLASELFGHEKGAFTNADTLKKGFLEVADKGTIFLDEVAEMPPSLQAKLLKVIEEKEFFRVGGVKPIKVDVRFIAATNQNIAKAIERGSFRKDLYYRLNVMEIFIPPLRDRKKDIEPLVRYFLRKHLAKLHKDIKGFSSQALDVLRHYSFPGNVRELENIVERAIILEKSNMVTTGELPNTLSAFQIETNEPDHVKSLENITREYAQSVLDMTGGNKVEAARLLGISRTSLWRMLKNE